MLQADEESAPSELEKGEMGIPLPFAVSS